MKIGLLGTPVSSLNQGVKALGASLVNLLATEESGVSPLVFTGNHRACTVEFKSGQRLIETPVIHYRLSPRSRYRDHLAWIFMMAVFYRYLPGNLAKSWIRRQTPWIEELEGCGFAGDIRGGDSFSDIYGFKRFAIGFIAASTVLLIKGTMVQFPQTYGPFKSPLARWMARFLLRRSSVVVARDKTSRQVAQDLIGDRGEVLLSPDVAFSLMVAAPGEITLDPPHGDTTPRAVVGVNVNGLMYRGGYTRDNMFGLKLDYPAFLRKLVVSLLDEGDQDVWLVPHTYGTSPGDVESDPEASVELRNSLPGELQKRVRIVLGEYDPHEVKGIIGTCGFFIGSRMHSCIAALSQGVPCVGVAYSMKFRGVFESVGMEDWVVDGREVDEEQAVERVMELYRMRDGIRTGLAANAEAARHRLKEVFAEILGTVSKPVG